MTGATAMNIDSNGRSITPCHEYSATTCIWITMKNAWNVARCVVVSHVRNAHHSVMGGPPIPHAPASTPEKRPMQPSAGRPPVTFGKRSARNIKVQNTISPRPTITRKACALRACRTVAPSGTPTMPPTKNGLTRDTLTLFRTLRMEVHCPSREPSTTSGTTCCGASIQAQNEVAMRPKANPDSPCTKPEIAPTSKISASTTWSLTDVSDGRSKSSSPPCP